MTDDELARWRLEQARRATAMTPQQMAERALQQQAGMQNAAGIYRPEQADNLRNIWPSEFVPVPHKPTRMERLRAWLRNLWSKA